MEIKYYNYNKKTNLLVKDGGKDEECIQRT